MNSENRSAGAGSRRRKAERWPLRPGDLPEPRFVDQEGELAEAGENAVYRAMLFGLRSRGLWSRLPPWPRGVALGLSIFLVTGIFSTFWPILLVIWIVVRNQKSTPSRFFTIPEIMLEELMQTPQGPRDWTLALWARSLRPGGRSATPMAFLTFLSVLLGLTILLAVMLGPPPVQSYAWLAGSAGMLLGGVPFILSPSATAALPAITRQLRGYRVELLRRRNPLLRVAALILRLTALIGLLILVSSVLVFAMMALTTGGLAAALNRWGGHPSAPGACFVAGLLLVTGAGLFWRRRVKLRRDDYLRTMDREMESILEDLRYRHDRDSAPVSHRGGVPRAIPSRPPGAGPGSSEAATTHVR